MSRYRYTAKWISAAPFIEELMAAIDRFLEAGVEPDRLASHLRDMAADLDDLAKEKMQ